MIDVADLIYSGSLLRNCNAQKDRVRLALEEAYQWQDEIVHEILYNAKNSKSVQILPKTPSQTARRRGRPKLSKVVDLAEVQAETVRTTRYMTRCKARALNLTTESELSETSLASGSESSNIVRKSKRNKKKKTDSMPSTLKKTASQVPVVRTPVEILATDEENRTFTQPNDFTPQQHTVASVTPSTVVKARTSESAKKLDRTRGVAMATSKSHGLHLKRVSKRKSSASLTLPHNRLSAKILKDQAKVYLVREALSSLAARCDVTDSAPHTTGNIDAAVEPPAETSLALFGDITEKIIDDGAGAAEIFSHDIIVSGGDDVVKTATTSSVDDVVDADIITGDNVIKTAMTSPFNVIGTKSRGGDATMSPNVPSTVDASTAEPSMSSTDGARLQYAANFVADDESNVVAELTTAQLDVISDASGDVANAEEVIDESSDDGVADVSADDDDAFKPASNYAAKLKTLDDRPIILNEGQTNAAKLANAPAWLAKNKVVSKPCPITYSKISRSGVQPPGVKYSKPAMARIEPSSPPKEPRPTRSKTRQKAEEASRLHTTNVLASANKTATANAIPSLYRTASVSNINSTGLASSGLSTSGIKTPATSFKSSRFFNQISQNQSGLKGQKTPLTKSGSLFHSLFTASSSLNKKTPSNIASNVSSFIKRNTPAKQTQKELDSQLEEKSRLQAARQQEAMQKKEEYLKMKAEEAKQKRLKHMEKVEAVKEARRLREEEIRKQLEEKNRRAIKKDQENRPLKYHKPLETELRKKIENDPEPRVLLTQLKNDATDASIPSAKCKQVITSESGPKSTSDATDKISKKFKQNDYGIDDLNSGDETDDADSPKKPIPSWAEGTALKAALVNQYYANIDTLHLFGLMEQPDLTRIFKEERKRFRVRTSSALWTDTSFYPFREDQEGH